jgi:hypothetical protein
MSQINSFPPVVFYQFRLSLTPVLLRLDLPGGLLSPRYQLQFVRLINRR